ncbi:MAG: DUF1540 domain-containing protein [Chloroflexota bacterium]
MATIRCTVSNCEYWGDQNFCQADQILVMAPSSPIQTAEEHGVNAEQLKQTPATTDEDTLCYTFSRKS